MDRFERCLSIFKLDTQETRHVAAPEDKSSLRVHGQVEDDALCLQKDPQRPPCTASQIDSGNHHVTGGQEELQQTQSAGHKRWRAVRVDLVVSPFSQFAFALLGWTGSKVTLVTDFLSSGSPLNNSNTDRMLSSVV